MTYKVLIGATGSVASLKIPELVNNILNLNKTNSDIKFEYRRPLTTPKGHDPIICASGSQQLMDLKYYAKAFLSETKSWPVQLIVTEHAKHFFNFIDLPMSVKVHEDEHEWSTWKQRGDDVLHIELGKWADLLLIAPLDANTLAKMAQGICDNLLTCTTRAWDMKKPLLFCPAMNTRMWEHPITKQQVDTLKSWSHIEIPPTSKKLMCGDVGVGAMAEVVHIVKKIRNVSGWKE